MHTKNIGSVLVKDGSKVIGIITVNNLLRQMSTSKDPQNMKASKVMSSPVITIPRQTNIDDLMNHFNEHEVSRMVLVNNNGEPVGIVKDTIVRKYNAICRYNEQANRRLETSYGRIEYT